MVQKGHRSAITIPLWNLGSQAKRLGVRDFIFLRGGGGQNHQGFKKKNDQASERKYQNQQKVPARRDLANKGAFRLWGEVRTTEGNGPVRTFAKP